MPVDVRSDRLATPTDIQHATGEMQSRLFSIAALPEFHSIGGQVVTTTAWNAHTRDGIPIAALTSTPSIYQPEDIINSRYVGVMLGDPTGLHNGKYHLFRVGYETGLQVGEFQDDDNRRFDDVRPDYDVDTVLQASGVLPHQLFSWISAFVVRPHESMSTRTRVRIGAQVGQFTRRYVAASLQFDTVRGGPSTSTITSDYSYIDTTPRKGFAVSFTSWSESTNEGFRNAEASFGEMSNGNRTSVLRLRDLHTAQTHVADTLEFARTQANNPFAQEFRRP